MAGGVRVEEREASAGWLARRAVLSLALMVGFYAFSLAIVGVLLWVPYAEVTYLHRVQVQITVFCLGAAAAILWSLVPRRDRFEAPGPRLDARAHPRLFALIDEVASATGERPPDDVYLVNQVNAFVTQRGGVLGFGSRRVMGVGWPLVQALSVNEFRAVVAHEFGHYGSGDVKLAPLVYRTRAAIGRTIDQMRETHFQGLFVWYGRQFLRLTHAVSRQQEFVADAVAARVAGAQAQAAALRRVTTAAIAFDTYMRDEVAPVLRAGYLPPIAEGFRAFCHEPDTRSRLAEALQHVENDTPSAPFDTHPPLRDRLTALGETLDRQEPRAASEAALLDALEDAARSLLEFEAGAAEVAKLLPIRWEHVGDAVIAPAWRSTAAHHGQWLAQFSADRIPTSQRDLIGVGSDLVGPREINVNADERVGRAVYLLGTGIACALLERGWKAETGPGRPVRLVSGAESVDPFAVVHQLIEGALTADQWRSRCQALGIAGTPLGTAESATT